MITDLLQGVVLGLNIATAHFPHHPWQNGVNPGVYAEAEGGWAVGAYLNTQDRWSVWGGKSFTRGPFKLTLGAVTGYQRRTRPADCASIGMPLAARCTWTDGSTGAVLAPLVAPSVALPEVMGATPRLTLLLRKGGESSYALHLSVEHKF